MLAEAKKKKKKINEDDLPQIPHIFDAGNGSEAFLDPLNIYRMAKLENGQIKMLNLSMNPI